MRILQTIIKVILLVTTLPGISIANIVEWTSGDYEIRSDNEWYHISELYTYNDVTVKMYGGGVHQFSMYDNSEFSMYGPGSVDYLNLYENATASFFGGDIMTELYIDPANTGWVKVYAYDVRFEPYGPYGEGTLYGRWFDNINSFNIDLKGNGAYSHIQIVPEPATIILLGFGAIVLFRNKP
jgi:hypothetical protein